MLIVGGNQSAGGYEVDNSLRFNEPSSDKLTRSNGTPTSQQKFTHSVWVKRSTVGNFDIMQGFYSNSSNYCAISFLSTDRLDFINYEGSTTARKITTAKFRDVSAWYHIVVAVDTTLGTANDRIKMYVNGVLETAFDTNSAPSQNANLGVDLSTQAVGVGEGGGIGYLQGYLAESVYIDGQQLDPTSFGEFDSDSGIWKPIDVSGLTFGTNGYYLQFQDSSALGDDTSGNSNDFTVSNLTAIDQTTDTCTNNFATLNSLLPTFSSTFTEGNLKWTPSTASQYYWSNSTFGLSQGKWYMEAKLTNAADHNYIGIASEQPADNTTFLAGGGGTGDANDAYQWGYKSSDGQVYNNASGSSYGNTYTTGDIMGMYLDLDNNKLYFAKNGTIQNSGTGVSITDPGSVPTGVYHPCVADGTSSNSSTWEVNFGNPTYTISSGNSDPNGYGNFEYDPSAGTFDGSSKNFYALNTKNLAEYG